MNWISFYLNTKQLGGGSSSSCLRSNGESFFLGIEQGPASLKYLVVLSLNDGYMECEELKLGSWPLCQNEPAEVQYLLDTAVWKSSWHAHLGRDLMISRTHWRDHISHLEWKDLGMPQEELEGAAEEGKGWSILFSLLRAWPKIKWMDGCADSYSSKTGPRNESNFSWSSLFNYSG